MSASECFACLSGWFVEGSEGFFLLGGSESFSRVVVEKECDAVGVEPSVGGRFGVLGWVVLA